MSSTTARMQIARCARLHESWTTATAPWHAGLRTARCSVCERSTTRSRRLGGARSLSWTRQFAALRLGAYQLGVPRGCPPVRRGERVRRARSRRRAGTRRRVHECCPAPSGGRDSPTGRGAAGGRRSRRRFATRTPIGWRRPGGATSAGRCCACMRAQNVRPRRWSASFEASSPEGLTKRFPARPRGGVDERAVPTE